MSLFPQKKKKKVEYPFKLVMSKTWQTSDFAIVIFVLFTIFKLNNVMICYDISAISITNYVMARWFVMK